MVVKISEETKEVDNLIAQAKNGAGKTGAFVIGSLLRVDTSINKVQVIVIGHTRELVNQTADVYVKATKYAPTYRICNLMQEPYSNEHVVVSALGTILSKLEGRSK